MESNEKVESSDQLLIWSVSGSVISYHIEKEMHVSGIVTDGTGGISTSYIRKLHITAEDDEGEEFYFVTKNLDSVDKLGERISILYACNAEFRKSTSHCVAFANHTLDSQIIYNDVIDNFIKDQDGGLSGCLICILLILMIPLIMETIFIGSIVFAVGCIIIQLMTGNDEKMRCVHNDIVKNIKKKLEILK